MFIYMFKGIHIHEIISPSCVCFLYILFVFFLLSCLIPIWPWRVALCVCVYVCVRESVSVCVEVRVYVYLCACICLCVRVCALTTLLFWPAFLKQMRILSWIRFTRYFIEFVFVETDQWFGSNPNVNCPQQTFSQRSSMADWSKHRALASYFPVRF